MSVTIGHASIDENGKAYNGAAGDQTAKEVCAPGIRRHVPVAARGETD